MASVIRFRSPRELDNRHRKNKLLSGRAPADKHLKDALRTSNLTSDLYKIVYCSRSEIGGPGDQVANALLHLLEAAQTQNERLGITGALLFYSGVFAQTLEGSQSSVEHLFHRIQQDTRHSEVTVAFRGPRARRDFPAWSMAFADGETVFANGGETSRLSIVRNAIDAVFAKQDGAGDRLIALLKTLC